MSAARILRPEGRGRWVIFCDHASNFVPPELDNLGLPHADLQRHIAWDIGAAGVTETLSSILDAPAILSTVSRLVIDCNRHPDSADLIPEVSDATVIPGNKALTTRQRAERLHTWFRPYHDAVESIFEQRAAAGRESIALSVHSMTASIAGKFRPWQIALSSHRDRSLADPVLAALRKVNVVTVGDNEPYDLDPAVDYSTPFHAMRRHLPHLQVEFRQDEIAHRGGQQSWARFFASALP